MSKILSTQIPVEEVLPLLKFQMLFLTSWLKENNSLDFVLFIFHYHSLNSITYCHTLKYVHEYRP